MTFEKLDDIFRMMTPTDLMGAQKLSLGTGKSIDTSLAKDLINIVYGTSGARTVDQISKDLTTFSTKAEEASQLEQFKRIIQFYKTGAPCTAFGTAPFIAIDSSGKEPINVTFEQVVGTDVKLNDVKKSMGIMLCNSGFMSPAIRNSEKVEKFLNFMPTIIASRMVPLLDVEFAFKRGVPEANKSQPHMWSPGLLKFLLGGDNSVLKDSKSPTSILINANEKHGPDGAQSVSGMEMFTSPQTLINTDPASNIGRYVDVIDPMRPLMTLESFSVNITPNVGLYSYKKATVVFKLHDRSRLSEIADLIRPQVYQDKDSAPTVWITYGWRHPVEPGNPYADFINENMLVRDAYGIINTQFEFDQMGQVNITLSLWTKGIPEMRTSNVNGDGSLQIINDIRDIAKKVARYKNALGISTNSGTNREIRGFTLLESAESGTYPSEISSDDIKKSLSDIKTSLNSPDLKLDKEAVKGLIEQLEKLYNPKYKGYIKFKETLETQSTLKTNDKFQQVIGGADPFLPSIKKDEKRSVESKSVSHPLTNLIASINEYYGESEIKDLKNSTGTKVKGFQKKAVSLGKLISVFTAEALKSLDGIDELQLYFYQFNDHAGSCAAVNIAEFPIDMPVFLDQYRDHIQRKGNERVTLEEFLRLVIDSQLHDSRAIGYGHRKYFAPYDPSNKSPALKKNIPPEQYELAKGEFIMPAIELYIETVQASTSLSEHDKLNQIQTSSGNNRAEQYTKIMRLHIFDKTNNPYKTADLLLRSDDGMSFKEADSAWVKQQFTESSFGPTQIYEQSFGKSLIKTENNGIENVVSNQKVKEFVSKMVPTIIHGMNASSVSSANLASKQDPLLATAQMQALAKGHGKPQTLSPNGADVGGLPLRIIPASLTLDSLGCPLLSYGQVFFIDFNTGTTVDNMYLMTGLTHNISPGKFSSQLTLTFHDAYGKFFSAPTITDYIKSLKGTE
jgi:hypothetical protein